jgi:SprT protein
MVKPFEPVGETLDMIVERTTLKSIHPPQEAKKMDIDVAEGVVKELMSAYGLDDWSFRWSSAEAEFGACWHGRKEIVVSKVLTALNSEAKVIDVILHEIAHALAGPGAGHGSHWRETARSIGCSAMRCHDTMTATVTPTPRWHGSCPRCGLSFERREVSKVMLANAHCAKCHCRIEWTDRKA